MLFPQQNSIRQCQKLDGLWSFRADPDAIGVDQNWSRGIPGARLLAVPGSWNEQVPDLAHYCGVAWYERSLFVPEAWQGKPIRLRIGSANNKVRGWMNGEFIGESQETYLPCDFDVSSLVQHGAENRLVLQVDACLDPWMLPAASLQQNEGRVGFMNSYPAVSYDFFPYAGIHRSVYLYATGIPRIEGIYTHTLAIEADYAEIQIHIDMAEPFQGSVECCVEGITQSIQFKGETSASTTLHIPKPRLWDIGKGERYLAKVTALDEAGNQDSYQQYFGIRTVEVKDNAFLLNGKPVFFRGFGKHEDFHVVGKGLCESLIVRDFELLHWVGANSFRTSHYPYAEEWLDYADQVGMLVIDETPFVGLNPRLYKDDILARAKGTVETLIRRDRHHPCVVMWSLANEPNCDPANDNSTEFFKGLASCARGLDPTRPITYVAHKEPDQNPGLEFYDIVCINKYYGWYTGPGLIDETLPELKKCMERFHDAFGKPVILAEFGADAIAGQHRLPAEQFTEEYQSEIIEKQYKLVSELPWCIGAHVWAFADFKTAQSITRIIFNRKGVFTRERQPKMAAHMLRRLWNADANSTSPQP